MEALEPLYQRSMGQRVGLSYLDAKAMNLAYCDSKGTIANFEDTHSRPTYNDKTKEKLL